MEKVYLLGSEYKDDNQKDTIIYGNINDAISHAKDFIQRMCNAKSKIKQLDVDGYVYFGINLSEGILVYVQEKTIVYTTSSSYSFGPPTLVE